jgi:hypothetical protein
VTTSTERARGTAHPPPIAVGWREWVSLPDWGVEHMKAKIDTGARTSAMHAFALEHFERDGRPWVRFEVHPWQRSAADEVVVEAQLLSERRVKSSSGATDLRPVVRTTVTLCGKTLPIEVTLTRRDSMGFRMLIGRQALRRTFVVDPAASYLGGRPPLATRQRNRGRP